MIKTPVFRWFSAGFMIGLVQLIPGISGGTVAVIMNVYTPLITMIQSVMTHPIKSWRLLPYLMITGAGIVFGILTNSSMIHAMVTTYRSLTYAVFLVIILSSSRIIYKQLPDPITRRDQYLIGILSVLGLVIGTVIALRPQSHMIPVIAPYGWVLIGIIASGVMVIPGISGSMVLLMIGVYEPMIQAINTRNWEAIILLCIGSVMGIALSVQCMHWLFNRYKKVAVALVMALIIGSSPVLLLQILG